LFHKNYRTGRLYDTAIFNVDETGFKGFEKDETHQEAADTIVKLAEQLKMEVDVADVEELLESHGAEL
jgi:EAL domain-containing protein (putative c-di-GMP-specific phosphodiesterase class I)